MRIALLPLVPVLVLAGIPGLAQAQETPVPDRAAVVHVLNRITFGPRPGDVEMVEKMGLHNYIESQLHPETIDDSAVDKLVAQFELLQLSSRDLSNLYAVELDMAKAKKEQNIKDGIQADDQKKKKGAASDAMMQADAKPAMTETMQADVSPSAVNPPATDPEPAKDKLAKKEKKLDAAKTGETPLVASLISQGWNSRAVVGQLDQAKLVRAIDSQRQLQEVLVDFWGNHFNIDIKKKPDFIYKVADDRDVIRPHILGKFRDLLEASAKSPAMLHYLDNASSTVEKQMGPMEQIAQAAMQEKLTGQAPEEDPAQKGQPLKMKKKGGINENYARELMELHTIGINGGYTQKDIQEVARCFTGWSIDRQNGSFTFKARDHDNGAKVVLGHQIPAGGGIKDGEMVLDILVSQPACSEFIAREMCQRFVSDDPPASLVDRVAGVFRATDGDLRQVTEAILTSPEFMDPASYNNKIKSPLEFAVSAVRATDASFTVQPSSPQGRKAANMEAAGVLGRGPAADKIAAMPRQSLNWHLLTLGQPLFACTPPTGYKEDSRVWVSPGALIERLNFAMALTEQKVSDVNFDSQKILKGADLDNPDAVLNEAVSALLPNNISPASRAVLEKAALPPSGENKTINPTKLIALILGSPEFQRK